MQKAHAMMIRTVEVIERREAPTPHNAASWRALVRVTETPDEDSRRIGFSRRIMFGISRDGLVRETWNTLAKARAVFESTSYP